MTLQRHQGYVLNLLLRFTEKLLTRGEQHLGILTLNFDLEFWRSKGEILEDPLANLTMVLLFESHVGIKLLHSAMSQFTRNVHKYSQDDYDISQASRLTKEVFDE